MKGMKVDPPEDAEKGGSTSATVSESGAGSAYSGNTDKEKAEANNFEEPWPAAKKRRGKKRCRPGSSKRKWKQLEEANGSPEHPQPEDRADDGGSK